MKGDPSTRSPPVKRRLLILSTLSLLLVPGASWALEPSAESDGDRETTTRARAPLPSPGYVESHAESRSFWRLGVFAQQTRVEIGNQATVSDVETGASIHVVRNLFLTGGYRLVNYDIDLIDSRLDAQLSGPFFGVKIRF